MGKLIQLLGLLLLVPAALNAQSATNFAPAKEGESGAAPTPKPAADMKAADAKPASGDGDPIENRSSRYVGSDLEAYMAAMSKSFAMRSRTNDPFGMSQDPTPKPVKPKVAQGPLARPAAIQSTPYSEIVGQIRVTTVIPAEGRFLVGTRSFGKGDKFPIAYRGKNYLTQVTEVTSTQIVFRNLENSETGVLKLDMMPPGMSRGTNGQITAPGMQPSRADAPLEIEGGAPQASGIN